MSFYIYFYKSKVCSAVCSDNFCRIFMLISKKFNKNSINTFNNMIVGKNISLRVNYKSRAKPFLFFLKSFWLSSFWPSKKLIKWRIEKIFKVSKWVPVSVCYCFFSCNLNYTWFYNFCNMNKSIL